MASHHDADDNGDSNLNKGVTMLKRQALVIIGAGGFGREVAWLVQEINHEQDVFNLVGFLDDAVTSTVEGYPVLGTLGAWLQGPQKDVVYACALGDPMTRFKIVSRLESAGLSFATLIHPSVRHSHWVTVGEGSILCAGVTLTTNIQVGRHSILNLHCTVGHDTRIGDFTSMMPGVHISGEVKTGEGVYLGTSAAVINQVSIGPWTVVGAGAVVAGDLPGGVVAVGVPAKPIKTNRRAPEQRIQS